MKKAPAPTAVPAKPAALTLPHEWSVGNTSYRASVHPTGYAIRTYLGGRMRRMEVYTEKCELLEAIQETKRT